ncbi:DUF4254 domain-containing protein [Nocardia sp. NPDC004068]|uniref:DUF4254 domain-containing protein n=1 Tax=Nocardia sp. NPDC004068 TaxID=3364303 RepID=UPI003695D800
MTTEYFGRVRSGDLPSVTLVLRSFRVPPEPGRRDHGVLESAHRLARCHERRDLAQRAAHAPNASPARVAACVQLLEDIDRERLALIARIDNWVADNISHREGASLHTETLGAVIDRMAEKWVAAQDALGLHTPPRPAAPGRGVDGAARLQWMRLAELADGYKDLITDVLEHRRRLPVF